MYDVNVWGVVAVTQAFAPLIIKAKGSIANLASVAGLWRAPFTGKFIILVLRLLLGMSSDFPHR